MLFTPHLGKNRSFFVQIYTFYPTFGQKSMFFRFLDTRFDEDAKRREESRLELWFFKDLKLWQVSAFL